MRTVRSLEPSIPLKDRLSARLGLLFLGLFLGVLVILVAWTMFGTIADRQQVTAQSAVTAPVIVIDPKIQSELAKALAFDALPASGEVLNPFVDRAGIGSNVVVSGATNSTRSSTTPAASTTGPASTAGGSQSFSVGPQSESGTLPFPAYDVRARYEEWTARQKSGEVVGPEAELLSVEDLVPVGFASGGDRADEVMLYSAALCRTFSFPAGTRLFDGWLNGFDQREVVFTFQNGIRRKSYSVSEPCRADSRMAARTGQE